MNYEQALEYIHSVNWTFCKPGLARITALCRALGDPQKGLRFIHVAGTNGKGSTSAMLASILQKAGYRTGLYTSPYIRTFCERIRVDGENIPQNTLATLTERIRPIADKMADKPTEFELITALAFEHFYQSRCDVVVLEVGLGGRLDSTNVIENTALSIITGIDFDHTALLGNTIEEIAAEKAGIIKEGRPVLFGGGEGTARDTVCAVAREKNAPFCVVDRSSYVQKETSLDGTIFDYTHYTDLHLPLLGAYQPYNATLVLTAIELLREQGFAIDEQAVRQGLAAVRWPARFELLSRDPVILYDGGHNPEGVRAAVASVQSYFGTQKVNLLSGVMADKDRAEMIETMKPIVAHAFAVTPNNPRALAAEDYAAQLAYHGIPATSYASVVEGVRAAIELSKQKGIPLLCLGSLYLYEEVEAAVRACLRP
ncbi:MAG: bifunctional folylpolyglutamate synthase/dihydrofolate synthase [Ruminococcaceae bacterium]|nr:bifunctional folylpolyglutamate synthase/dihydrofolate synthase [Oscillospiraceae bacterium]